MQQRSKNLSTMSNALFQHIGTSGTNLCYGRSSSFCFFFSLWLAMVLRWKNVEIRFSLPRSLDTAGILRAACDAMFRKCAKQPMCNVSVSLTARSMLAALSHTIAGTLSFKPHSFIASVSNLAILFPVWLSKSALVCRMCDTRTL